MAEKIAYEKKGEVAYITFNRPEAKNAIDLEMHRRLREIWTDFRDDSRLRVAVVTGTGDAFCAGADLKTHVPEWANAGPSLARDKLPDGFAGGITRGLHRWIFADRQHVGRLSLACAPRRLGRSDGDAGQGHAVADLHPGVDNGERRNRGANDRALPQYRP